MEPNDIHIRALEYIDNTGGEPLIEWFDVDHEPIGPLLRRDLAEMSLTYEKDGRIGRVNL